MGTLSFEGRAYESQWFSDPNFDGLRLEIISPDGDILFDVGLADDDSITVNTFGHDLKVELVLAAIEIARPRQSGGS